MVTDNDLVVSKDDGDKLVYVETVVANGKTDVQKYDGAYDGKYYDIGNGEIDGLQPHQRHRIPRRASRRERLRPREQHLRTEKRRQEADLPRLGPARSPAARKSQFDEIFDKAP
jgi:hypothetical protein